MTWCFCFFARSCLAFSHDIVSPIRLFPKRNRLKKESEFKNSNALVNTINTTNYIYIIPLSLCVCVRVLFSLSECESCESFVDICSKQFAAINEIFKSRCGDNIRTIFFGLYMRFVSSTNGPFRLM